MDLAAAAVPGIVAICNAENRGFAAACNQGAQGSAADYLLFLNPDTVVGDATLSSVVDFMQAPAQADVGVCGIRLVDEEGRPSTAAARFPTLPMLVGEATGLSRLGVLPRHLLTAAECRHTRDVDQVIGAFFLIRRSLFESLGGFDERFFVYFEEVDLSYRARLAGWRSVYFAGAEAFHHGGLSSGQVRAKRLFYSLRSRR
jgi:GT2 family glycosyltransferase